MHRQCLSASVTQSDMSKYQSLVEWSWSQSGAAVTAQRGPEEDWTMCYYFSAKLITVNQRRLGLKDNRMITCDRKPFTSHPGQLSFCSNQESRENNKGDWCYQHESDYSPFNLIILYYEERERQKAGGKNTPRRFSWFKQHRFRSKCLTAVALSLTNWMWVKPSAFAPRWQPTTVRSWWQYEGKSSFCSDLLMQRNLWNPVSLMQNRHIEKIQCRRAAGSSRRLWLRFA